METVVRSKFCYYFFICLCLHFDGLSCSSLERSTPKSPSLLTDALKKRELSPENVSATPRNDVNSRRQVRSDEPSQQNLPLQQLKLPPYLNQLPQQFLLPQDEWRSQKYRLPEQYPNFIPDCSPSVVDSAKDETSQCSTFKQAAKQLMDMFSSIRETEYPREIVFTKDVALYNIINNRLDIPGALRNVTTRFGDRLKSFDAMIAILCRLRFELPTVCPLGTLIDKFIAQLKDRESEQKVSRGPPCAEDGGCVKVSRLYDLIELLIEKLAEKNEREHRHAIDLSPVVGEPAGRFHLQVRRRASDVQKANDAVSKDVNERANIDTSTALS